MFFDLFVTSAAPFSALPEPELSEEDERALTAGRAPAARARPSGRGLLPLGRLREPRARRRAGAAGAHLRDVALGLDEQRAHLSPVGIHACAVSRRYRQA
jgi:hypothetical protein